MVPQTVMVAPEGVQYERIPAQYGTREHVEMVAPARTYYVPVPPRCNSCGYRDRVFEVSWWWPGPSWPFASLIRIFMSGYEPTMQGTLRKPRKRTRPPRTGGALSA
jgi:hypothetical protein